MTQSDPTIVASHIHTVIFENDKLRVLKVTVKPGDKAAMHWHPEGINYILSGGKLRFTKSDGSIADIELAEGQVTHSSSGSHAVENIGATEVQTIHVEMKENK